MIISFLKNKLILLTLTLLFVIAACDPSRVFEENKDIEEYVWKADQKITFQLEVNDTVSAHNFYINVRNADDYSFSNLYLFITTTFPDGNSSRDTLECILADDQGHWLGKGLGDIWDNQIPFKKNVRFPMKGIYSIALEQAMRTNELKQIMDVGVRIEKHQH